MTECARFRLSLDAEPPSDHADRCPDCRAYLRDMRHIEERIRETEKIPVPGGFLDHCLTVPERHRARVRARNRILMPAAAVVLIASLAPLFLDALWLTSGMLLTGSFAAVSGILRARLIRDA